MCQQGNQLPPHRLEVGEEAVTARLGHRPDPRWLGWLAKQPEHQPQGTSGRQRGGATLLLSLGDRTTRTPKIYRTGNLRRLPLILNTHLYYTIPGHFGLLREADPYSQSRAQRECTAHSIRADMSFAFKRRNCKSSQKLLGN